MPEALVRWRYAAACAVLLYVVVTADAGDTAPVRTPDADARARVAAAEREAREHPLPRIIRWIVRSLGDGLTGPRP